MADRRGPLRSARRQISHGYFGKHTAVVDFCEDNYQITNYIAEFTNSVSNLAYLAVGYHGIQQARQESLPIRVQVCYGALIVLGVGSTLFHATLMKTAMMMDDLPMIWLVCILLYAIMQPDAHSPVNWPLAAFLAVVNIAIIACDLAEVNQWFHYTAFAALGIAAALRFVWLVVQYPKALNTQVRQEVLRTFATGTALILGAFAVWNFENIYCDDLYPYKQRLGLPFALVLELHAYWHILTAIGAYLVIASGSCICLAVQEKNPSFALRNGRFGLPHVFRSTSANEKIKSK